jgi:hypothetical protein
MRSWVAGAPRLAFLFSHSVDGDFLFNAPIPGWPAAPEDAGTTLLGAAQWAGDVAHNPYRSPCFTMRRYGL